MAFTTSPSDLRIMVGHERGTPRGRGQGGPAQFCPIRSGPFDRGETAGPAIASRFKLQVHLRQTKSVIAPTKGLTAEPRVAGE
jgi:hypothetical protein